MKTCNLNEKYPGVFTVKDTSRSIMSALRKSQSELDAEIYGAMMRYFDVDQVTIDNMVRAGKIDIEDGWGGSKQVIDTEKNVVICTFTMPQVSNRSEMNWHMFPSYDMRIEFKFGAFDNKLHRDIIKNSTKRKGK